jgi:phosphopentomutase
VPQARDLTRLPRLRRAILIVLDSVGAGALPDAAAYGDAGSDTLGHLGASVGLRVPMLRRLGLSRVSTVPPLEGAGEATPIGAYGRMAEASPGKDSVTGHWELMGLVLDRPFPTFPHGFPADLMQAFEARIGRGTLGNIAASGTAIIDLLGPEHIATGRPIVYTSADSVFQIAAHEEIVPVGELYRFCEIAFELACRGLGLGRVIARPFVGAPGAFSRTSNRRDFAQTPFEPTLLDRLTGSGHDVLAIGKIEDLFAGQGVTRAIHTTSDEHGMREVSAAVAAEGTGFIFANLVDFDAVYGHRNNPVGYAANLEQFDARLATLLPQLTAGDVLFVTADHGNDPTTDSTDHSREHVPLFAVGEMIRTNVDLGVRRTFADLGQTLAELFAVEPLRHGTSFLQEILRDTV